MATIAADCDIDDEAKQPVEYAKIAPRRTLSVPGTIATWIVNKCGTNPLLSLSASHLF